MIRSHVAFLLRYNARFLRQGRQEDADPADEIEDETPLRERLVDDVVGASDCAPFFALAEDNGTGWLDEATPVYHVLSLAGGSDRIRIRTFRTFSIGTIVSRSGTFV